MEITSTVPAIFLQINNNNDPFSSPGSNAELCNDPSHKISIRHKTLECPGHTQKENHDLECCNKNKKTRRVAFASDALIEKSCSTVATEPAVSSRNLSNSKRIKNLKHRHEQPSCMASPRKTPGSVRFNDEFTIVTPRKGSNSISDPGRKGHNVLEGEQRCQDFDFRRNCYSQDRRLLFNMAGTENTTDDADVMAQTSSLLDGIDTSDDLECTTAVFSTSDWLNSEHKIGQDSNEMTFPDGDNSLMSSGLTEVDDKQGHLDMVKYMKDLDEKKMRKKTLETDDHCGVNTVDNCLPYKNSMSSQTPTTKTKRVKSEMEKVSLNNSSPDRQVTAHELTDVRCHKSHCEIKPCDGHLTSTSGTRLGNVRSSGRRAAKDQFSEQGTTMNFLISTISRTRSNKSSRHSSAPCQKAETIQSDQVVHRKSILKKTNEEISSGNGKKNLDFLESPHCNSPMVPSASNMNDVNTLTSQRNNLNTLSNASQTHDITNALELPNSSVPQNSQHVINSISVQCNLLTPNPTISRFIPTPSPEIKERALSINSSNNTKHINSLDVPIVSQEASFISTGIQCDLSFVNSHDTFYLDDSTTGQIESYALDQSTLADSLHVKDSCSLKLESEIHPPADSQHLNIVPPRKNNSSDLAVLQHSNENYTNVIQNNVFNQEKMHTCEIRSKTLVLSNSIQVTSRRKENFIIKKHEQIKHPHHQYASSQENQAQNNRISDLENISRKSQTLKTPRLKEITPGHQDVLSERQAIHSEHHDINVQCQNETSGRHITTSISRRLDSERHVLPLECQVRSTERQCMRIERQHVSSKRQDIYSEPHTKTSKRPTISSQCQNIPSESESRESEPQERPNHVMSLKNSLSDFKHISQKLQPRSLQLPPVPSLRTEMNGANNRSSSHTVSADIYPTSSVSKLRKSQRRDLVESGLNYGNNPDDATQADFTFNRKENSQTSREEMNVVAIETTSAYSRKDKAGLSKSVTEGKKNFTALYISWAQVLSSKEINMKSAGEQRRITQSEPNTSLEQFSQPPRLPEIQHDLQQSMNIKDSLKTEKAPCITPDKKDISLPLVLKENLTPLMMNLEEKSLHTSISTEKVVPLSNISEAISLTANPKDKHVAIVDILNEKTATHETLSTDVVSPLPTICKETSISTISKEKVVSPSTISKENAAPPVTFSTDISAPPSAICEEKSRSIISKGKSVSASKIFKKKAVSHSTISKKNAASPVTILTDIAAPPSTICKEKSFSTISNEKAVSASTFSKEKAVSASTISKAKVNVSSKAVEVKSVPKSTAPKDYSLTTSDACYDPISTVSKDKNEPLEINNANTKERFSNFTSTKPMLNERNPKVFQGSKASTDDKNNKGAHSLSANESKVNKFFKQNRSMEKNACKKKKPNVNSVYDRNIPINTEAENLLKVNESDMAKTSVSERIQDGSSPAQSSSKHFQLSDVLERLKKKSKKNCNKRVLMEKESFISDKQKLQMSSFKSKRVHKLEDVNKKTEAMTLGFNNNVRMDSLKSKSIMTDDYTGAPTSQHTERNKKSVKSFSSRGQIPTPAKIVQWSTSKSLPENASHLPEMNIPPHLEWSAINQILNYLEPTNESADGTQERLAPITKRYLYGEHMEDKKTRILHIVNEREENIQENPTEKKTFTKSTDSRAAELRIETIQALTQNILVEPSAEPTAHLVSSGIEQGRADSINRPTAGEENNDKISGTRTDNYDQGTVVRAENEDQGTVIRAENQNQGTDARADILDQDAVVMTENNDQGTVVKADNHHQIYGARGDNLGLMTREDNYAQGSVERAVKYDQSSVDEIDLIKERGSSVDDWFDQPKEVVSYATNTQRIEEITGRDKSKLDSVNNHSKSVDDNSNPGGTRDLIDEEIGTQSLSSKDGTKYTSVNETITPTENDTITPTENVLEITTETESERITEDEMETPRQKGTKIPTGSRQRNRRFGPNQYDSSKFAEELYTLLSQMATREPSNATSHVPSRLSPQAEDFLQATGQSPSSAGQKTTRRQPTRNVNSGLEKFGIKDSPNYDDSGIGSNRSSTIARSNIHHNSNDPAYTSRDSQIDQQRWHQGDTPGRNVKKEILTPKPRVMADCYYYSDVNAIQLSIKPIHWPSYPSSRRQDSTPLALDIRFHMPSVGEHAVRAAGNK